MKRNEIEAKALELSPADRELLATRLLSSLESEPVDVSQVAEWDRRLSEYRADPAKGVPAEEVHREIRRKSSHL